MNQPELTLYYYLIGYRADTPIKARISSIWLPGFTIPTFKEIAKSLYTESPDFEGSKITILSISKLTKEEFDVFRS